MPPRAAENKGARSPLVTDRSGDRDTRLRRPQHRTGTPVEELDGHRPGASAGRLDDAVVALRRVRLDGAGVPRCGQQTTNQNDHTNSQAAEADLLRIEA